MSAWNNFKAFVGITLAVCVIVAIGAGIVYGVVSVAKWAWGG